MENAPKPLGSSRLLGVAASVLAVAAVTAVVALLHHYVPVLSLAVLYLLAVLPIAVIWGLPYALPVAVAGMLTFEFFFLPPVHTFRIADSSNWLALAVFVVTAAVVSELAARSRRRAGEAALLAEIASSLLEHGNVSAELDRIAAETARALRVERTRIELGEAESADADRHALTAGGRQVGTLILEGSRQGSDAARRRLLPALASLLGVAIDRERLAKEAFEAEALRRSDVIKTALLRAVSHDLRTPLMAISTSASTLAHDEFELAPGDRQALLATILAESRRLDRLVGNLLDLSRLQAGAAQPETDLWAVDELIVQALDGLGPAADRVDVSLPEDSLAVRVDANQVQRVLANLIENALKYSPAGERVRVQVSGTESEVLVRVIDHGLGLPADELEQVFEPFHRGSGSAGRPGAGLGLAIARGFAAANDGRVWAESRAGQGASFVLALPAAEAVGAGA
jgi:two-component system sensor histidine kinase KdpD